MSDSRGDFLDLIAILAEPSNPLGKEALSTLAIAKSADDIEKFVKEKEFYGISYNDCCRIFKNKDNLFKDGKKIEDAPTRNGY